MEDKTFFESDWVTVKQTEDNYIYTEGKEGVAILPYRDRDDAGYEYLIRAERNPLFDELQDWVTVITGRRDPEDTNDGWYLKTASRELKEEAGIDVLEEVDRWFPLGLITIGKDKITPDVLVAVNVTGLVQEEPECDGSESESNSHNFWVDEEKLKHIVLLSPDSYIATIVSKFLFTKDLDK